MTIAYPPDWVHHFVDFLRLFAQRYRADAAARGLVVTLAEKAKAVPATDLLVRLRSAFVI